MAAPVPELSHVDSVSAGGRHMLVRLEDGTLRGWGSNESGRLGNGNDIDQNSPARVAEDIEGAVRVSAGDRHSLALRVDGTVLAWGDNQDGELGNGATKDEWLPLPVLGIVTGIQVEAGQNNSAVLLADRTLRTWGENGQGQLGIGSMQDSLTPRTVMTSESGPPLSNVVAISLGGFHMVALLGDGTIRTWGSNTNGQLGDGTLQTSTYPVVVRMQDGIPMTGVVAVAAGYSHTLARLRDGTVLAWGRNAWGQLGDGTRVDRTHPVPVRISPSGPPLGNVTSIAAAGLFSLARLSDGTVRAWGSNMVGELGNGSTANSVPSPVVVLGLSDVIAIDAGSAFGAALIKGGTIRTWGSNLLGALGNGAQSNAVRPEPLADTSEMADLAVGYTHMVAALQDGTVRSWGNNLYGQLGTGTRENSNAPVEVPGLADVVAVAAGRGHSIALSRDGNLLAWGLNIFGQLGDGTTKDRLHPAPVVRTADGSPVQDAIAIAAGMDHSLALLSDGTILAWGLNNYGQLGDGTQANRNLPVPVFADVAGKALVGATRISTGPHVSGAVLADGRAYAWGNNYYRQLGMAGIPLSSVAIPIPKISGVLDLAIGYVHMVALLSDGSLWTWGSNFSGQLGDGTTDNVNEPALLPGLPPATAIATGTSHTVALWADGTVSAWGYNETGALGNGDTDNRFRPTPVSGWTEIHAIHAGGDMTVLRK